ncbi:MAG TPA: ATP-binding protein [Pyrinomonadaceae bacterium]
MITRPRVLLALCGVGLLALMVGAVFGPRVGAWALAAGSAGLLAGLFAARGTPASHDARGTTRRESAETDQHAGRAGALLEATMNGMREGVLVLDDSLRVISANNAAGVVFGKDSAALPGQPLSVLTRNPAVHGAYRAALELGGEQQVNVELLGAERRVLELRAAPLKLDGGAARRAAIGVFFDITQLERLERIRQEFLTNVSHELRTPLTAILAFVETLESGALDEREEAVRFLSIIRRNAERMHTLIEDIMELSAIESGQTNVEARAVRLHALAQESLSALAAKAAAGGVSLVNEVAPDVSVHADPRRLEQMLLNLVDNAIKFSRPGGSVTIRHERGERDLVSVADTGEGIAPEHLPRIFERFYRVDRARARALGGTGLGLAIVKHLARAHGGEVSVRSAPGEGSTFSVELPCAQSEGAGAA